jgi:hypothetical protein
VRTVRPRLLFAPLAAIIAALCFYLAIAGIGRADDPPLPKVVEVDRTVDGMNVDEWRARSRELGRLAHGRLLRLRALQRTSHYRGTVSEAINLTCAVYGSCSTLWRRASCESHLYRYAQNAGSHASGLFQFLPSTWRSTPFARFSVFSPYANALAAGWMIRAGRGGEWVCR